MKYCFLTVLLFLGSFISAQNIFIQNNPAGKSVRFGNDKIKMVLVYNKKCRIKELEVNGEKVISSTDGIYSQIRTADNTFSSLSTDAEPVIKISSRTVEINNIKYGADAISEKWLFTISDLSITLSVTRNFYKKMNLEEIAFPSIKFNNINTWEGAFLGYGGVAWFYLFNEKLCTYGVHTDYSSFWNSKTGNGLRLTAAAKDKKTSLKFSRSNEDNLVVNIGISEKEMLPRYDSLVNRRRFIRGKTDVWSPVEIMPGKYSETITFTPFNYQKEYSRGSFNGINGEQLTSVLNTIARIGVIDAKHFGGNSWHTPYGPICLHEQYIAELGLAINDPNYIKGYKECLDFYRDNAIKPDGRVLPRWAYEDSDAMPGTATPLGFYEAQWGYLLDSNPDFVINVSDMFNMSGDKKWVALHKTTCEKALDYILKRDSNGNHLVEMINSSLKERKGSDWIDIIWASFENAFVNAKLYHALTLWADIEKQLGDKNKSSYYSEYAAMLKTSFNKSTADGGFWDDKNKCYIHWRDKDNSIHGTNMVIPVNFMAIAYGICDDKEKIKTILDKIEEHTSKENLFFWPLCLYSYEKPEGNDWQFPFPNYENGDIFLSWGSVGVAAYATYKPEIALKYIKNIMAQHSKDGLAFQRYGRVKQDGRGDDILAGNSLAIAGLYKSIFGINPYYNRLYLNPHLTGELLGTEITFNFRESKFKISLNKNSYSINDGKFCITAPGDFGFFTAKNKLFYFKGNSETPSLIAENKGAKLSLNIITFTSGEFEWTQSTSSFNTAYTINNLIAGKIYKVYTGSTLIKEIKCGRTGSISFNIKALPGKEDISVKVIGE